MSIQYHNQTKYQVGDFVEVIIGANSDGNISQIYQVIFVNNTYPLISYLVQNEHNDKRIVNSNDIMNIIKPCLRIGNIVSVREQSHPTGYKDGTIIKKIIKDKIKYIVKFNDDNEMEFSVDELFHPVGYFINI